MARSKPKPVAGEDPGSADATLPPIKRQAVVIVHGQGEQRPMGTVRDFVDALWSKNDKLDPVYPNYPRTRAVWMVPDDRSGIYELQRITTPGDIDRKTDFFELYYADIFVDTPLRNLLRWMTRLLWRPVSEVEGPIRGPWQLLWIFVVVTFALALTTLIFVPDILRTPASAAWTGPEVVPGSILLALSVLGALLPRFLPGLSGEGKPYVVCVVGLAFLGVAILSELHPGVLAFLGLLLACWLVGAVLLPFFGDAASYLSAQTETISSRQSVRQRGIKLLRALHDDEDYERIVVIAHSLGTVVAYDLLHILWREVGPLKDNPPGEESISALREVESAIRAARMSEAHPHLWDATSVAAFQAAQWKAFNRLRLERAGADGADKSPARQGWKVSDFVTLGSPLTHAALLVTESKKDLKELMKERVMPTAPPQPYDANNPILYLDRPSGKHVAHHGAVFSVVRWTNLFDPPPPFWLEGDLISGPVSGTDRFGCGVRDAEVTIRHGHGWKRWFTHNAYWSNPDPRGDSSPEHIEIFREAVDLFRPPA